MLGQNDHLDHEDLFKFDHSTRWRDPQSSWHDDMAIVENNINQEDDPQTCYTSSASEIISLVL